MPQLKSILVAVDFTENSRNALRYASELAKSLSASMTSSMGSPTRKLKESTSRGAARSGSKRFRWRWKRNSRTSFPQK